ncbi:hypothetical protein [Amycolatopsis sp. NPDC021455]|uniref:hypothetical protein n=1 Tax=Amycolatopsis sp. NPDC021455 TaxID=3154901 RepID=UPI0033F0307B
MDSNRCGCGGRRPGNRPAAAPSAALLPFIEQVRGLLRMVEIAVVPWACSRNKGAETKVARRITASAGTARRYRDQRSAVRFVDSGRLKRPNVALVASNAPNATLGALDAPNATLGRIGQNVNRLTTHNTSGAVE